MQPTLQHQCYGIYKRNINLYYFHMVKVNALCLWLTEFKWGSRPLICGTSRCVLLPLGDLLSGKWDERAHVQPFMNNQETRLGLMIVYLVPYEPTLPLIQFTTLDGSSRATTCADYDSNFYNKYVRSLLDWTGRGERILKLEKL